MTSSSWKPGDHSLMDSRFSSFSWIFIPENPADVRVAFRSSTTEAPARQPQCKVKSRCTSSEGGVAVTTSEMQSRPPLFSTPNASRNTYGLSGDRLMTQLEMITSTLASAKGKQQPDWARAYQWSHSGHSHGGRHRVSFPYLEEDHAILTERKPNKLIRHVLCPACLDSQARPAWRRKVLQEPHTVASGKC